LIRTKVKRLFFLVFILVIVFVSCKKKEVDNLAMMPSVTTMAAFDISYKKAYLGGNVTDRGSSSLIERGICWSLDTLPTMDDNILLDSSGLDNFSLLIDHLVPATKYYYRAFARNSQGIGYGQVHSFITLESKEPSVETNKIRFIGETSIICSWSIVSDNGSEIIESGLAWAQLSSKNELHFIKSSVLEGSNLSLEVSGLMEKTDYSVRAYAKNSKGIGYGSIINFTTGTVIDIDENVYRTVKIGNQVWMSENLATTKYNDGSSLQRILGSEWYRTKDGGYNWYEEDIANKENFGAYYNIYAIQDEKKLCPTGWRLPTREDWIELENFIGSEGAGKLKDDTVVWECNSYCPFNDNSSGFSAFPSGLLYSGNGTFQLQGWSAYYWMNSSNYNDGVQLDCEVTDIRFISGEPDGLCVRCIREN